MPIKTKLKFLIPVFDIRVKIFVGDVDEILREENVNILPPQLSAQWVQDNILCIALPEDFTEKLLTKELVHTTVDLFVMWGLPMGIGTEPFFRRVFHHLKSYIIENL